jgi:hypothetical protein
MNTARYLIAKYIPDLRRGEPRNIGVVVWTPYGIAARFAAEKPGLPGEVDGRSIPSFVSSANAYKQWIQFWHDEIAKPELAPVTGGQPINRSLPEVLEVLSQSGKGNFALVEGGLLLDPVNPDSVGDVVDYLYGQLVDSGGQEEPRDATLDDVLERILEQTNLRSNRNFHTGFSVTCQVAQGKNEDFEFSHAYKNGTIQRLYQRVPLSPKRVLLRKTVHDTAWMFEKVTQTGIVQQGQAVALVYLSEDQRGDRETARLLDSLSSVARLLDVRNEENAVKEFQSLASLQHD